MVLTIGTLAAFALQIPAGALVDRVPAKRFLVAFAVTCISGSALLLALWPTFGVVIVAKVLHAIASCLLGPALAAISLGLVGHGLLSVRLGRNARFLSLGNVALCVPAFVALFQIRSRDIDPDLARGGVGASERSVSSYAFRELAHNRALLIFAGAVLSFQFANAAALPTMADLLAKRMPETATVILSICIFAPQLVVAAIAPWAGRQAQNCGRRPLLVLCFVALSARCTIFAMTSDPYVIVAAQLLDGISAATLGVLIPFVIADITRRSGHFNFAQGVVGAAVNIGASISTTLTGFIADNVGGGSAFLFLAGVAAAALIFVVALMPETRERPASI